MYALSNERIPQKEKLFKTGCQIREKESERDMWFFVGEMFLI